MGNSKELEAICLQFYQIILDIRFFFKSHCQDTYPYFLPILLSSAAAFWVIFTLTLLKIYDRRKRCKEEIANANIYGDRTDSFMQAPVLRYAYENEVESMMTLNRSPATRPACLRTDENSSNAVVYGTLNRNNKASKFIEDEDDFEIEVSTPRKMNGHGQRLFPTTSSPKNPSRSKAASTMGGAIMGANVLKRTRSNLRPTTHIPMKSSPTTSISSTLTRKKKQVTKTFIDDMDSDTEM